MKYDNQLRYALNIIEDYKGEIPLAAWLKDFFRANKQMGSNDRKTVSDLLYNYYRVGHSQKQLPTKEKVLMGLFLCNSSSKELLRYFKPAWDEAITAPLHDKIRFLQTEVPFDINELFPWGGELSEGMDLYEFCMSFLVQPDLFLRLRPGKSADVERKLQASAIQYKKLAAQAIALPNSTKLDDVIETDVEAVIQDYSSQRVGEFMSAAANVRQPKIKVWDSCAASGGKSIMIYDINPSIQLTVSDVRNSIVENLHKRFIRAGIKSYSSFVGDLSKPGGFPSGFDFIIADVPCSGSGTWSRTPEQLYFFKEEKISYYSELQKSIVSQLIPPLKAGGYLLYITCSVFKKENEEIVDHILNAGLKLEKQALLTGYDVKADSMFAALFVAP